MLLGTLGLTLLLKYNRVTFERGSLRDGAVLGVLLVSIFWLQTDGLRFTTTSKSGLITSLYVPFTPILAFFLKDRVKLAHGLGALHGDDWHVPAHPCSRQFVEWMEPRRCRNPLFRVLMHVARDLHRPFLATIECLGAGMDPGGHRGRRFDVSSGLSADTQRLPDMLGALRRTDVQLAMAFMVCFTTIFGFWGISKWQGYLSATEAAVVYSFEPLVAAMVGVFWVGEHFLPSQMVGAGLILLAMVVAELMPRLIARFRAEELAETPAD